MWNWYKLTKSKRFFLEPGAFLPHWCPQPETTSWLQPRGVSSTTKDFSIAHQHHSQTLATGVAKLQTWNEMSPGPNPGRRLSSCAFKRSNYQTVNWKDLWRKVLPGSHVGRCNGCWFKVLQCDVRMKYFLKLHLELCLWSTTMKRANWKSLKKGSWVVWWWWLPSLRRGKKTFWAWMKYTERERVWQWE